MVSAERYIGNLVEKFLELRIRGGRSELTIRDYRYILNRDLNILRLGGYNYTPQTIINSDIEHLIGDVWTGAPAYVHNRRSVFRMFLEYYGNHIMDEYPEPVHYDTRVRVDWLDDAEAADVYVCPSSPIEKLIIHLELRLALRRFDMMNIRLGDVHHGHIVVHGKGRKIRTVPFVNDTVMVLADYMKYRDSVSGGDRSKDAPLLLISGDHFGPSRSPGKTYVDNCVRRVCARAGVDRPISNHTLRRTCARMWWRAGVPLATISSLLGHSEERVTIRYIGLVLDDLNNGAAAYSAYFDRAVAARAVPEGQKEDEPAKGVDSVGFLNNPSTLANLIFCPSYGTSDVPFFKEDDVIVGDFEGVCPSGIVLNFPTIEAANSVFQK